MLFFNFLKDIDERALGASLYYARLADRLRLEKGRFFRCEYKELLDLKDLEEKIRTLGDTDIVLCNIGPYAWIYAYLREKYNKKFRIIRDVQTSFWIGYFLQEFLIAALARKGDVVLFPSQYCRSLYRHFFPESIGGDNSVLSYPLFFNETCSVKTARPRKRAGMVIGWLGRVSQEKNFKTAVKLLGRLLQEAPCKLYLCGPVQPEYRSKFQKIISSIPENVSKNIIHLGSGKVCDRDEVNAFFKKIDLLIFPSCASMESLGQVVIQAFYHGIPVIAADYAAAPELLPQDDLVDVRYLPGEYDLFQVYSLGEPDVEQMARSCLKFLGEAGEFKFDPYDYSYEKFRSTIIRGPLEDDARPSTSAGFMIRNTEVSLRGFHLKKAEALNKAMQYLKANMIGDIARSCVAVAEHLDFRPVFKLKNGI